MKPQTLALAILVAIFFAGCSDDFSQIMGISPLSSMYLSVTPPDGQGNVNLDASINFTFARPVDRAVVERNMHLISERMISELNCPDPSMGPHGSMGNFMMDSSMMRHLEQMHSTRGRFSWNGDSTSCSFRPDTMMTPRTQYMIHIGTEAMQMMRNRMGEMGGMGGHGFGMMRDDMILHFVTTDTPGNSGGH
jgi:hypothetical protein